MNQRTWEWLEQEKKFMWWKDNRMPLSRLELMAVMLEVLRIHEQGDCGVSGCTMEHSRSPLDEWKEQFSDG